MIARRIVLALQFWEGDKAAAMRNARRIADMEPQFRHDFEFCFVTRRGTEHDGATIDYVKKKFKVSQITVNRFEGGWPGGCNATWCGLMQESATRVRTGEWASVKALFTFEGDCIPVNVHWLDRLNKEWEATENAQKWMTGWVVPFGSPVGHCNGNMLVHPNLATFLPGIAGCDARVAWDCAFAPLFVGHWRPANFLENLYNQKGNKRSQLQDIVDSGVTIVHGVKDSSVEDFADTLLRKT